MTAEHDDALVIRLRPKVSIPARAHPRMSALIDALRERAAQCGCGDVSRDDLIGALLLSAAKGSDDQLRAAIEELRRARVGELPTAAALAKRSAAG